jgi:putative flippase GtrA
MNKDITEYRYSFMAKHKKKLLLLLKRLLKISIVFFSGPLAGLTILMVGKFFAWAGHISLKVNHEAAFFKLMAMMIACIIGWLMVGVLNYDKVEDLVADLVD